MRPGSLRHLVLLASVLLAAAGCAVPGPGSVLAPDAPSPDPDAIQVVASTSVLADITARVGGSRVAVGSLIPKGGEVHTFDPRPATLVAISRARLVVVNGLGLDDPLADVATTIAEPGTVILRVAEEINAVDLIVEDGQVNPHLWLDLANARRYATRIAQALMALDPGHADRIRASAAAYDARLADLDAWARSQFQALPASSRAIISLHDAFPYFARAYGLELIGAVISSPGQDPSAGEIANLVAAIRASGARAIFSEAQFSDKLARAIADETGIRVESNLYDDTLGDSPVDSFEGLIRWDVERIVAALK